MPVLELLRSFETSLTFWDDLLDHESLFKGRRLLFLDVSVDVSRWMDQRYRSFVENFFDKTVLESGKGFLLDSFF